MNKRKKKRNRRGALTVEFALVLPVFFMFLLGCIEFSRVAVLRSSVENAAYEGARRGIVPGATTTNSEASAREILDILRVNGAVVTSTIDSNASTVTVSVPITMANVYLMPRYFLGKNLQSTISLPLERT